MRIGHLVLGVSEDSSEIWSVARSVEHRAETNEILQQCFEFENYNTSLQCEVREEQRIADSYLDSHTRISECYMGAYL